MVDPHPPYDVRMNSRLAQDRYQQLRSTGHVEIPQPLSTFALALVGCLIFSVIGALFLYSAFVYSGAWTAGFAHPGAWMGLLCVGFFGVFGIPAVIMQMVHRSFLVLTWEGLAEYRQKKGEQAVTWSTAWRDIEAVTSRHVGGRWPYKGQFIVFLQLLSSTFDSYRSGLNPTGRGLGSVNSAMFGRGMVGLKRFAGGQKTMFELLDQAHRDFG